MSQDEQSLTVVPEQEEPTPPVLAYAGSLVGGLILGMFGAVLAPARVEVRGVLVPFGLVLVLLTIGLCARAVAWLAGSRKATALLALGWALPTFAFLFAGPGGDVLLPDEARTWWYLGGAGLLLVLALAWPLPKGAAALARARRSGWPDPVDPSDPSDAPDLSDLSEPADRSEPSDRSEPVDPQASGEPDTGR